MTCWWNASKPRSSLPAIEPCREWRVESPTWAGLIICAPSSLIQGSPSIKGGFSAALTGVPKHHRRSRSADRGSQALQGPQHGSNRGAQASQALLFGSDRGSKASQAPRSAPTGVPEHQRVPESLKQGFQSTAKFTRHLNWHQRRSCSAQTGILKNSGYPGHPYL